jgi:hypothetical protein
MPDLDLTATRNDFGMAPWALPTETRLRFSAIAVDQSELHSAPDLL